jgi:NhaA family Na+:H+ antiporter
VSRPSHLRSRRVGRYLPPLGSDFVSIETSSGLALVTAAIAAVAWANLDPSSYTAVWRTDLGPLTAGEWINDVLMTVFFFVVGLEIRRELAEGELRDPRRAALPAIAALGGMVVPALIFTAWNVGGTGARGWGVPMATDIAFALGVLALLGPRVRPETKLFLLALAIVDDVGAILVIALFYSSDVSAVWLVGAAVACGGVLAIRRLGLTNLAWYAAPAVALWVCAHEAGVHTTIAGVVLAFLLPTAPGDEDGPVERLEHALHPWTALLVVPLFALATAGVVIDGGTLSRAFASPITLGIVSGLVVGKILGISLFAWLALRFGLARLPEGLDRVQIVAVSIVAGIGFTVSLFVAELAFAGPAVALAKIGILAASLASGLLGLVAVTVVSRRSIGAPGP